MCNSHSHCRMEFSFFYRKPGPVKHMDRVISSSALSPRDANSAGLSLEFYMPPLIRVRLIPDVLNYVRKKHMESSCFISNVSKDNSAVRREHFSVDVIVEFSLSQTPMRRSAPDEESTLALAASLSLCPSRESSALAARLSDKDMNIVRIRWCSHLRSGVVRQTPLSQIRQVCNICDYSLTGGECQVSTAHTM